MKNTIARATADVAIFVIIVVALSQALLTYYPGLAVYKYSIEIGLAIGIGTIAFLTKGVTGMTFWEIVTAIVIALPTNAFMAAPVLNLFK